MKKTFIEKKYNTVLVESYKKADEGSPILGSFSVKGMTAENVKNQNGRIYRESVWQQPQAFGVGGDYIDENGKLRPTTLFGSLDHPLDDRAEFLGKESAIAWYDVRRNEDGTWDGEADILNTPDGRIVRALMEYAKYRKSSGILGVSSRAVGESRISESMGESVEEIIPEGFQLMSFDFVINPSFKTAVARFNESKGSKTLLESVNKLAIEDPEHAEVYKEFASGLTNENNKKPLKESDDFTDYSEMSLEELRKELKELRGDYSNQKTWMFGASNEDEEIIHLTNMKDIQEKIEEIKEIMSEKFGVEESTVKENPTIEETTTEEKPVVTEKEKEEKPKEESDEESNEEKSDDEESNEEESDDESEDEESNEDEESEDDESNEEDEEESDEESEELPKKISDLTIDEFTSLIEASFEKFFGAVEDPSGEYEDSDDTSEEDELDEESNEEEVSDDEVNAFLSSLTDEDLENASQEELEAIEKLASK